MKTIVLATGIYPPEIGGPAGYVHSLAADLVRRGFAPVVVTYGDERTPTNEGWMVRVVPRSGGALWRYIRYAIEVWKQARTADVVYLQGPVSEGFPGTLGARAAGKPTVMKIVGDYAWEQYQQRVRLNAELLDQFVTHPHSGGVRVMERIERWTSCGAKVVITPSVYLKRIVEAWGVASSQIRVVINSVSPLPETGTRDELRARFGVADQRVILTAVRAVPWKGVDFLLEALERLPPDHLLVVAGDGPMLDAWKGLAHGKDMQTRVRFLGRVNRAALAEWYVAADLFVLATGYEGYPHVVAEAVSVGLPCLVSDRGGNPETRDSYPEHVTVVPYRDLDAWVREMCAPRPRLAPAALRSFTTVVDETVEVLKTVCAS